MFNSGSGSGGVGWNGEVQPESNAPEDHMYSGGSFVPSNGNGTYTLNTSRAKWQYSDPSALAASAEPVLRGGTLTSLNQESISRQAAPFSALPNNNTNWNEDLGALTQEDLSFSTMPNSRIRGSSNNHNQDTSYAVSSGAEINGMKTMSTRKREPRHRQMNDEPPPKRILNNHEDLDFEGVFARAATGGQDYYQENNGGVCVASQDRHTNTNARGNFGAARGEARNRQLEQAEQRVVPRSTFTQQPDEQDLMAQAMMREFNRAGRASGDVHSLTGSQKIYPRQSRQSQHPDSSGDYQRSEGVCTRRAPASSVIQTGPGKAQEDNLMDCLDDASPFTVRQRMVSRNGHTASGMVKSQPSPIRETIMGFHMPVLMVNDTLPFKVPTATMPQERRSDDVRSGDPSKTSAASWGSVMGYDGASTDTSPHHTRPATPHEYAWNESNLPQSTMFSQHQQSPNFGAGTETSSTQSTFSQPPTSSYYDTNSTNPSTLLTSSAYQYEAIKSRTRSSQVRYPLNTRRMQR